MLRRTGRGPPQGSLVGDCAVDSSTVGSSAVDSRAADARAVRGGASRSSAAAGRKMMHAPPRALAFAYFCRFRFLRIQRVRVDVRGPHSRRKEQSSHNH